MACPLVAHTIHCAISVTLTPQLWPPPAQVTEDNVEAFVYEVIRLFPPIHGLCFWRESKREILALGAAMRDPAVWGKAAHRFEPKDPALYKKNLVAFANPAVA